MLYLYQMYVLYTFFVQQLKWESDETGKTTLVSSREEINSGFKRIDEGIHLIFCIVEVKTCTSTCSDTKGPMQNLCTVMPWPNCYAVLKQKGQQNQYWITSADEKVV